MYVEYSDWMILITKSKFALDCCFTAKPDQNAVYLGQTLGLWCLMPL
jgi:hypothetical protein